MQVNSEDAAESVGEGTGGDGETQEDEVEHRRYVYEDPVIQVLRRAYMHIRGTTGEHIGWRKHKDWTVKCKSDGDSVCGGGGDGDDDSMEDDEDEDEVLEEDNGWGQEEEEE